MKKTIISWLSILALMLTLAPIGVFAEDSTTDQTDSTSTESTTDESTDSSSGDGTDDSDDSNSDDTTSTDGSSDSTDEDGSTDDETDTDDESTDETDTVEEEKRRIHFKKRGEIKPHADNLDHRTLTLRVVWGDLDNNIEPSDDMKIYSCDGKLEADTRLLVRDLVRFDRNDMLDNKYGDNIEFTSNIGPGVDGIVVQVLAKEGQSITLDSECVGTHEFSLDDLRDGETLTASNGDMSAEVKLLKENSSLRQLLTPGAKNKAERALTKKFDRFQEEHGDFSGVCKEIKDTLDEFDFGSATEEEGEINEDFERVIGTPNPRLLEAKCRALKKKFEGLKDRVGEKRFQNGDLTFQDTANQWFTDFVEFASTQGIVEGFKDNKGKLTGNFGPADFVRITELAKIANKVAGHEEAPEENDEALSEDEKQSWAKGHFLRWKKLGISVETRDPGRYATRGEVFQAIYEAIIGTENFAEAECDLDSLDYSDLDTDHKHAKAACFLTAEGIVSGTDSGEIQLDERVRRAEIAKIVHNALKLLGADDDLEEEFEEDLPEEEE